MSPIRPTTAPSACPASFPVSNVSLRSVPLIGADTDDGVRHRCPRFLGHHGRQFPVVGLPRCPLLKRAFRPGESRDGQATGDWQLTVGSVPFRLPGGGYRPYRQGPPLTGGSPAATVGRQGDRLSADAEPADYLPVALDVVPAHIVQQAPTATDQLHQSPAGVMVA